MEMSGCCKFYENCVEGRACWQWKGNILSAEERESLLVEKNLFSRLQQVTFYNDACCFLENKLFFTSRDFISAADKTLQSQYQHATPSTKFQYKLQQPLLSTNQPNLPPSPLLPSPHLSSPPTPFISFSPVISILSPGRTVSTRSSKAITIT